MTNTLQTNYMRKYFTVLIPYGFGFLLSCFFMCMNAIQGSYLQKTMNISDLQAGWLTSIYFFSFFLAQLPIGILLDKFETKKVISCLFSFAVLGFIIFALSKNISSLTIGRFFIGIGGAAALTSALRANSDNYSLASLPIINAITLVIGGGGSVLAGKPLSYYLDYYSWQSLNFLLAIICVIFIIYILIFAPKNKLAHSEKSIALKNQFEIKNCKKQNRFSKFNSQTSKKIYIDLTNGIKEILHIVLNQKFLWFCFFTVLPYGFFMSIISLWMSPWLKYIDHFNINKIGTILSITAIGNILGPFLVGWIGNIVSNKGKSLLSLIVSGNAFFVIIQVIILYNKGMSNIFFSTFIWILFFISAQVGTLGFTVVVGLFKNQFVGRALTILNMLFFLSAFFCQNLYGLIENLFSTRYSISASYKISLGFFLLLQIIIILIYIFYYNSRKKYTTEAH